MKSSLIVKEPVIKLALTMEEAKWLKSVMQNPICIERQKPSLKGIEEDEQSNRIRTDFWESLSIQGV